MTIIHAIVLGVVEGITEFLPISSTAHLMISAHLLQIDQSALVKSFEIAIQLGAVCAVLVLYVRKILASPRLIATTAAGFLPTAVIGFVLYSYVKTFLLGNFSIMTWSLLVGGVVLIAYEIWNTRTEARTSPAQEPESRGVEHVSYLQALIIGAVQAIAVIPGVSRSAATILTGRFLGLSVAAATEFSFLLAVPTIAAATGYDLLKNNAAFSGHITITIVGFIVSCITALVAVRTLMRLIKGHSFAWFGVYRIMLAIVLFAFFV